MRLRSSQDRGGMFREKKAAKPEIMAGIQLDRDGESLYLLKDPVKTGTKR